MANARGSIGDKWLSRKQAEREIAAVNKAIKAGHSPTGTPSVTEKSAITVAADHLGENRKSLGNRVGRPGAPGTWKRMYGLEPDWGARPEPASAEASPFAIHHEAPPIGTSAGPAWELKSRPDNTYCFGAFGDLHAGSKYARWDVREDLVRRTEEAGAQVIFDTGNWIDGEKSFNRYDLDVAGLDAQCKQLAAKHPKTQVPIFAVTGADHEGWYVKSEGIDVGRYNESIMRDAGHDWTNLGYMQADVVLRNANTGKTAILRVMHPGGGTGYALSYRPQKIIEAMEGGEKPAVLLLGHYHKLDFGLVRNVWYVQTGCQQDQTPFMAQKALEAHVGGFIASMEQDPETGAITSFTPQARRYFNRAYYFKEGRANNRWNGSGPVTPVPRRANTDR
jgi:hypothetical protein